MFKRVWIWGLVIIWLAWSIYARKEYLPYDVNNTDVGTYLFQAQTFAAGEIERVTPQPKEFFQQWQAIVRDRSYAYYPPVHALFLSLPMWLGIDPWWMTWLLGGLSLWVVYRWICFIRGSTMAGFGASAMAISPLFLANGSSLLSHSSALFLTACFLYFVSRWVEEGEESEAWWAGIFLGLLFADRPVNALSAGIVWIGWVAWHRRLEWKKEGWIWGWFLLGLAIVVYPLVLYYHDLSGRWTLELFTDYWPRNRYGFGENLGRGEPGHYFQTYAHHDIPGFFANLKYGFLGLSKWWTGHEVFSWILLAAALTGGVWRLQRNSARFRLRNIPAIYRVLIAWMTLHVLLYAGYYTQSTPPSGPRYLVEIMPGLALLSGWLLVRLDQSRLGKWGGWILGLFWCGMAVMHLTAFYQSNARGIGARRLVEKTVREEVRKPAVVFIRSFWLGHPLPIFLNSLYLNDDIIFACDRGFEDGKLMIWHSERNGYVLSLNPHDNGNMEIQLIPIFQANRKGWLKDPGTIEAPFFVGSYFTPPLRLEGESFRKLFQPKPGEIPHQ